jgi:hypothetical protein
MSNLLKTKITSVLNHLTFPNSQPISISVKLNTSARTSRTTEASPLEDDEQKDEEKFFLLVSRVFFVTLAFYYS